MNLCGLYLRVSTEDQVQVRDGSLDTQESELRKYVDGRNSPEESWRVASVYREEGRSAKDTNRPEYQRMLLEVESGKVSVVLCTSMVEPCSAITRGQRRIIVVCVSRASLPCDAVFSDNSGKSAIIRGQVFAQMAHCIP